MNCGPVCLGVVGFFSSVIRSPPELIPVFRLGHFLYRNHDTLHASRHGSLITVLNLAGRSKILTAFFFHAPNVRVLPFIEAGIRSSVCSAVS
jgi:hypothetical protein